MNKLQIFFNQDFGQIRTVEESGRILFCGSDVAKALGYKDTPKAIKQHCKSDGWANYPVTDVLGREQKAKFINEGNLYRLISNSKLPTAEKFESWIFDDVLPTIRKTGGYVNNTSQFTDYYFSDCDNPTKQFISTLLDEKVKLTSKVNELLPKAETYDMVMDADGTFSLNQVAKFVGMGEYKLFQFLREQKILFYEGEDSIPYERFRKNKCFKVVMTKDYRGQGHSTTKVYPKGVDYICKVIAKSERTVA